MAKAKKRKRKGRKGEPSALSPTARAILERTRKARELLDNPPPLPSPPGLRYELDEYQRARIAQVMIANKGNISVAARELGIHRQALQRLLKRFLPSHEHDKRSASSGAVAL